MPEVPASPDTVSQALALLAAQGYTADFNLADAASVCPSCGEAHAAADLVIEHQYRFEGDSNPDDEAIVLGVRCPTCGTLGVIVSAYGPDADPDLFARLREGP